MRSCIASGQRVPSSQSNTAINRFLPLRFNEDYALHFTSPENPPGFAGNFKFASRRYRTSSGGRGNTDARVLRTEDIGDRSHRMLTVDWMPFDYDCVLSRVEFNWL